LPIVFALANAYKDDNYTATGDADNKSSSKSKSKKKNVDADKIVLSEERLNAAKSLIDKYKTLSKHHLGLITSMTNLFDAYIELANHNIEQHKTSIKQQIPLQKNLMINQIKNFNNMPVLTTELEINKDANYSKITSIVKFENSFSLAGGINLPKIIVCHGSDGLKRKQLCKSRDDTRQGNL